jgi:hypothetical protein
VTLPPLPAALVCRRVRRRANRPMSSRGPLFKHMAVSCVRDNRPKEKVAPEGGATKLTIEKSHTPLPRCGVLSSARQATAGQGGPLPSAIESERAKLYAFLVGLGIKHLRFDNPRQCSPQTYIVRGKGKAVGFVWPAALLCRPAHSPRKRPRTGVYFRGRTGKSATQSDSPDDGSAWHAHIVGGDEAKPPVFGHCWRLCCVGPPQNDIPPLSAAVVRRRTARPILWL